MLFILLIYLKTIKQYKSGHISPKDMNSIYNKLTELNRTDKESKKEHIRNIKENKNKAFTSTVSRSCFQRKITTNHRNALWWCKAIFLLCCKL